jgi:tyrosyl-tRNA synthetase
MGILETLGRRGLIAQITHESELKEHLETGVRTAYTGYDPTADSLHVGHLITIMALKRWQKAGHRVAVILGGGTGVVGDPTGKTEMRKMLERDQLKTNKERQISQISRFVDLTDPKRGIVLNNADWLAKLEYLPFLQDIGRHFSVNRMLTAESVKQRLEKGLTFLEFNYMLLQSYDFLHLYRHHGVTVQMGGDDQWSNMLGGVELVRRLESDKAFCVTLPLLTTSDGRKMGKTEGGAVWLDAEKTPPFDFFQYWRNIEDDMVMKCLNYLTEVEDSELVELGKLQGSEINQVKIRLAYEVTKLVHGEEEAIKSKETAASLFAGGGAPLDVPQVFVKRADFRDNMDVGSFLVLAGIVPSKKEVTRLIEQGGLFVADKKVETIKEVVSQDAVHEGVLIRRGKKHYYRVLFSD